MTQEQAIEKVRKLLNMTTKNGATEGEVQNALAMAQRLMVKFDIEMDSIEDKPEDDVVDEVLEEKTKTVSSNRTILVASLSEHYRCKVYKSYDRIRIIGTPTDVKIFKEVIEFAYSMFIKLAAKWIEDLPRTEKTKAKNSYLLGFVKGIKRALEDNESEYALVIVVPEKVQEAYDGKNLTRSKPFQKSFDHGMASYNRGYSDGYEQFRKSRKQLN